MRRAAVGAVVLLVGLAGMRAQAAIPEVISFQGKLSDSVGDPIIVATDVEFNLYAADTGGASLWTETHAGLTPDANGLCSVMLGATSTFAAAGVDFADPLWLGVTVGGDAEMTPRFELGTVPYAMNADRLDGFDSTVFAGAGHNHDADYVDEGQVNSITNAMMSDNSVGNAEMAANSIGNAEMLDNSIGNAEMLDNSIGSAEIVDGAVGLADLNASDLDGTAAGELMTRSVADGRYVNEGQVDSITSVMITDGQVTAADLADGAGSGIDADMVDGSHASAFAGSSHNHLSQTWTGSTTYGLRVQNTTGSGVVYGLYGASSSTSGRGVYGESTGTSGRGVEGLASAASGSAYGVSGRSTSASGFGVYGWASAPTGGTCGTYGQSDSTSGYGAFGYVSATSGTTYGVCGRSRSPSGYGVYGINWATTGSAYGVYGQSDSTSGYGVRGYASAATGNTRGVYGVSASTAGRGVYGLASAGSSVCSGVVGVSFSPTGRGVWGETTANSGVNYGVLGRSNSTAGIGVYGVCTSATGYDFYAGGAGINYGASSSIRWKTAVTTIPGALAKVEKLRGVYFDWDKEHGGRHDIGMIAEEVGEVLPEIVGYEENGKDAIGMDYTKMAPLLVEAVKELKAENDTLRAEVAELKATVQALAGAGE